MTEMENSRFPKIWLIDAITIIVTIATFTPLVLPQNRSYPFIVGIPYTMWVGFLVSILFVALAYVLSILRKKNTNDH